MAYSKDGMWGCGAQPREGDIVKCIANCYTSIRVGEQRVVLAVRDGNIELANYKRDPSGWKTSFYKSASFELVSRPVDYKEMVERAKNFVARSQLDAVIKHGENRMNQYLHVAILTDGDGFSWPDLADRINSDPLSIHIVAATSGEELKARIKARIETYPDEVWVILGGMSVASGKRRPSVDVTFQAPRG